MYPVRFPAVFGHEGSGVEENVGARITKLQPGDHVVMSYRACGQCPACRNGDPTHCADIFGSNFGGVRADGSATIHHQGLPIFGFFQPVLLRCLCPGQ
jgi:aryl-alcohol dehydrogenase